MKELVSDRNIDDEQQIIFVEASAQKKLAVYHHYPEVGAEPVDSTCFGRNYFDCLDVDVSIDDK